MPESAIYTRRSIRRYTDEPLSKEDIVELLRAGMHAPSARNYRPWEFIVVKDKAKREAIGAVADTMHMSVYAPCVLVLLADKNRANGGSWPQDLGACAENILLRAAEMGLGACWLGVCHMPDRLEKMNAMFDLPEGYDVFCAIAVGHTEKKNEWVDRFEPERIHWENY